MATPSQPLSLWTTKAEREKYDAFADLYALIKTVDKLEKARREGGRARLARGTAARGAALLTLALSHARAGVRARRGDQLSV
jgi:hypothetical protein